MCPPLSRVQVAWVWAGGCGRPRTPATMSTMSGDQRRDSRHPRLQRSGWIALLAQAHPRPSSLVSTSRCRGLRSPRQCLCQHRRLRRQPRHRRPLHRPALRLRRQPRHRRPLHRRALGCVAMGDAPEETAKADGAVRAEATVKGTAMATSAQLEQRSRPSSIG